jgi:Protein of unknown function (DUF1524)/Excalibur calcium-binding domain
MPAARNGRRRPALWVGLAGLGLSALVGAAGGWSGALILAFLYLALSAGWGVLTTRTWWGRMSRRSATVTGAGALAAVVVVAGAAGGTEPSAAPESSSRPTAVASADPSADPTASASPTPSAAPTPSPSPSDIAPPLPAAGDADPAEARSGTALATVALLEVKGRAPKTGYDRDQFGSAWSDVDRNGCDQRNDVLRRDLVDVVAKPGTHGCVILTGTFHDPYSGETIPFQRGQGTSSLVQIDHVVALSDAWQKGAQQWDAGRREAFANDLLNLLASKGSLNQQKGDGDTATWLPPNKAFRCAYVARQVAVKHTYGLWVTSAERDAMTRVLSTCPDEPPPTGSATPTTAATPTPAPPAPTPVVVPPPAPEPAPPAPAPEAPAPPADVYYANCDAVRAAGAAPIHVGEPGYSTKLDRDGDGVGCE